MVESYAKNVIEAALLAAGRPLTLADLRALFEPTARPDDAALGAALEQLSAEYAERGIELKQTASGWRIQVRREFAAEVSRLWSERPARYSRALLETLALIAYRQPITRGEIEGVRGVAVNPNIVKTLLERDWIRVVGHRDVPGRPELLGTTRGFLDYFGLQSLDELPPLSELKALTEVNLQLDLPAHVASSAGPSAPAAEFEADQADSATRAAEPGSQTAAPDAPAQNVEAAAGASETSEDDEATEPPDGEADPHAQAVTDRQGGPAEEPADERDASARQMRAAPDGESV